MKSQRKIIQNALPRRRDNEYYPLEITRREKWTCLHLKLKERQQRTAGLIHDPEDVTGSTKIIKPSKPPPIVFSGVENVNEPSKLLESISNKEEF